MTPRIGRLMPLLVAAAMFASPLAFAPTPAAAAMPSHGTRPIGVETGTPAQLVQQRLPRSKTHRGASKRGIRMGTGR